MDRCKVTKERRRVVGDEMDDRGTDGRQHAKIARAMGKSRGQEQGQVLVTASLCRMSYFVCVGSVRARLGRCMEY